MSKDDWISRAEEYGISCIIRGYMSCRGGLSLEEAIQEFKNDSKSVRDEIGG